MKASAALAWRVILVGALTQASPAWADGELLHTLIDQRLTPVSGLQPARCSDAEFLRRVSLDLVGMPPTADQARAFLADPSPDKRQQLIDRLLASPHHARHLATTLDIMLMERRANTHIPADDWQAWLLKSVQQNKPWNVLAREILLADGEDPAQRPAARFSLDRGSEANLLTRDIGRIFFGRDMQCAQCHDHPLVDDYLQSDYHGLLAFVAPGYALPRKEGDKQFTVHAERAGTDLVFESVFVKGTPHRTGPRLPDDVAVEEPFFLPGDEYQVPPADNVKSVPKFSRRAKLAELATSGSNQAFNQNIANRLWAHMLGRGLVHPPDLHHPDNPATDPELLRVLGERFAAMNFDIRAFVREIALSGVYQRSFDGPGDLLTAAPQAAGELAQLEQQRAVIEPAAKASAEVYQQSLAAWHQAEATRLPAATELDGARNAYAEAKKKVDEAAKAVAEATTQLQAKQAVAAPLQQAATAAQQAAQLLPAEPELVAAAAKLTARSQQLAAEVAAMTKTVEEKTAALQPPTAALNIAKTSVEAALAKTAPLAAAERQAEQAMLAARRQAAADARSATSLLRRLAIARRVAQLPELQQAIASANQNVASREAGLAAARTQLDQQVALAAQKQSEADQAAAAQTAAQPQTAAAQTAAEALAATQQALAAAVAQRTLGEQAVGTATTALAAAQADAAAKQAELSSVTAELTDRWMGDFTVASLKPLTPEQLCWSVFQVTGVYGRYWQTEVAELDKSQPQTDEQKQDPAWQAPRSVELEQKTFDKLKGNVGTFVTFYGAAAGQPQGDFFSTADQALFAANAGPINSWVAPAGDNVTERVIKQADPRLSAEELYLGVLTRLPSQEETTEVVTYLTNRAADKNMAAQELVWGLLNSAEFRFNH